MRKILLDTNAITALFMGDRKVLDAIAKSETVYASIFVLGELFAGFKGASKELQNKQILSRFLEKDTVEILEATMETADVFGMVKHGLRAAGTPIPINDVWIASHAIETGSILISYDTHFKNAKGVRLWDHATPE